MLRHALRSMIRARRATILQLSTIAIGVGGHDLVASLVTAVGLFGRDVCGRPTTP
jgi:hypothetical protein